MGLSTYMDGVEPDGYNHLVTVLRTACNRYLMSGCIPDGIKERANSEALSNPLVVLFFLMYDVIVQFNDAVVSNVSKAAHTNRA